MVSRPPRVEFGGAVHHVVARGDRREEIFRDDRDRGKFLGYLAEGAERYRVKVHCYVPGLRRFGEKEIVLGQ